MRSTHEPRVDPDRDEWRLFTDLPARLGLVDVSTERCPVITALTSAATNAVHQPAHRYSTIPQYTHSANTIVRIRSCTSHGDIAHTSGHSNFALATGAILFIVHLAHGLRGVPTVLWASGIAHVNEPAGGLIARAVVLDLVADPTTATVDPHDSSASISRAISRMVRWNPSAISFGSSPG